MSTPPDSTDRPCPSCGSAEVSRIVYGLMDFETFQQLGPGVIPGGCCVQPYDRRCRACGTSFSEDGGSDEEWFSRFQGQR